MNDDLYNQVIQALRGESDSNVLYVAQRLEDLGFYCFAAILVEDINPGYAVHLYTKRGMLLTAAIVAESKGLDDLAQRLKLAHRISEATQPLNLTVSLTRAVNLFGPQGAIDFFMGRGMPLTAASIARVINPDLAVTIYTKIALEVYGEKYGEMCVYLARDVLNRMPNLYSMKDFGL